MTTIAQNFIRALSAGLRMTRKLLRGQCGFRSERYEEINNAYSEFYKYINRSFEVLERNKLEDIKFIDSGICDLIDNAELLKEGDYEKYIYERLAKVQKEGKKVSISPDDIDLLLGYIEKKRQKGRS
jgi:hypothetical protein